MTLPLADAISGAGIAIHVIAAIALLAALVWLAVLQSRSGGAGADARELRLVRHLINPALLVTLLAGIVVAADKGVFGSFYVLFGFVAVLAVGGAVGGYIAPRLRELEAREAGPEVARQVTFVAVACAVLVLATIGVMSSHA